jgi:hypothetical protein
VIDPDFAWLAAALPLAGFASYLRDTVRGKAQPNRVSWALWALAPLVAFVAELVQGTTLQVASVTLALGVGPLLVVLASLATPFWAPARSNNPPPRPEPSLSLAYAQAGEKIRAAYRASHIPF